MQQRKERGVVALGSGFGVGENSTFVQAAEKLGILAGFGAAVPIKPLENGKVLQNRIVGPRTDGIDDEISGDGGDGDTACEQEPIDPVAPWSDLLRNGQLVLRIVRDHLDGQLRESGADIGAGKNVE